MSIRFKYFTAENCPNCKASTKAVDAVKKLGFKVREYSSADADGLAEASFYSVQMTPTLILLYGQGKEKRWSGVIDKKKLLDDLKGYDAEKK
jgi:hypothetical protein